MVSVLVALATPAWAQEEPAAVFKSSVDLVSMAAIVRDGRGKIVQSLRREDFEVLDSGKTRPILDLRTESAAPASVALLMDGSGSMKVGAANDAVAAHLHRHSRRASTRRATTPRSTRSTPGCSRSRNSRTTSRPSPTA